jgi:hypothetical protein
MGLGVPGSASGQVEPRAIVLRTVPEVDPPGLAQAAEEIEWRLGRERTVLEQAAVARLLGERHSSEATAATPDDFDALARESETALEHVAFGRRKAARQAVGRILERAQGALETLNREARSARRVLNSCLYLVRALADGGQEDAALRQSIECARLVPDMSPSASEHPPNVRDLFRRAKAQIESGPHGSLRVESQPTSSCDVFLNGRRLGRTPFVREHLPTGEYRVQVECEESGRPGRVHRIILAAEPREVVIDTRFDVALRTAASDIRLSYDSPRAENRRRLADALRVAAIVDATTVYLVTPESQDIARIDRLRVAKREVVASVRVPLTSAGLEGDVAKRAVSHLLAGRSVDLTGPVEEEARTWKPPRPVRRVVRRDVDLGERPPVHEPERSGRITWPGWFLTGIGVAALGVGWGLQGVWFSRHSDVQAADPTSPGFDTLRQRREDIEAPALAMATTGTLFAVAGLPWLVSGEGARWWHWTLGVAGLAGVATGIGIGSQEGKLDNGTRKRRVPLGPLVALSSVPFVAVPIVAISVRDDSEDGTVAVADEEPRSAARPRRAGPALQVAPRIGRRGAGIVLGGKF